MQPLTMEGTVDLRAALDELDPAILPTEAEIESIMRKRLTKGALVLTTLGPEEAIQEGDTVIFAVTGGTGKYDKPRLTVTVGQGLYNKDVEAGMVGHRTGDSYDTQAEGTPVHITIQEVRRKTVPEPTDAMAAAMGIEGVSTVEEYRTHQRKLSTDIALGNAMWETLDKLIERAKVGEPDEETINLIASKTRQNFVEGYLEDHPECSQDKLPEDVTKFLDEEIFGNREGHVYTARMCFVLSAALGIPLSGDMDPTVNYDAGHNLREKLIDTIFDDLQRRK